MFMDEIENKIQLEKKIKKINTIKKNNDQI